MLRQADESGDLEFRPATSADSDMLLRWRNDPLTVAMSRGGQPVDCREHETWLGSLLEDSHRILLIAMQGDEAVGTVRFDKKIDDEFEISITVRPQNRRQGLGGAMLCNANEHAFEHLGARSLFAAVREENRASRHIFEQTGYSFIKTVAGMREYRLSR